MKIISQEEQLLCQSRPDELLGILSKFFDKDKDPGKVQIVRIEVLIEKRKDAAECSEALDVCNTYLKVVSMFAN